MLACFHCLQTTCVVSLSAHSGCVWDVCPLNTPVLTVSGQQQPCRAATCAADGTVRVWNLSLDTAGGSGARMLAGKAQYQPMYGAQHTSNSPGLSSPVVFAQVSGHCLLVMPSIV